MRTRRPALALAAVFLVAPTLALAHGEQLFFMMFVVPPLVVPAIFVLAVLVWQAGAATKLRAGAAVAAASVATFGLNYGLLGAGVVRLGRRVLGGPAVPARRPGRGLDRGGAAMESPRSCPL